MNHRSAIVVLLLAGCSPSNKAEETGSGEGGCDYQESEVTLDTAIGDDTPRAVIELLERPADGTVRWHPGEGEYIEVAGASAQTTFHAEALYAGGPIQQRDGADGTGQPGGGAGSVCVTVWVFDVEIAIDTADSALAETWVGEAIYVVTGTPGGIGTLEVRVDDPRPFSGSLSITEKRGVSEQWETHELFTSLGFSTSSPDFVGMTGRMQYHLANLGDGEGELATVDIGEFAWAQ